MLEDYATLSEARDVAFRLSEQFEKHAIYFATSHAHPEGREVWTKGIWKSFCGLRDELGSGNWTLYPEVVAAGPGRAKGEFLVDFFLFDNRIGPRIACESEISQDSKKVEWAFDKLSCVKSDIKILIFEYPFEDRLPPFMAEITEKYLTKLGHISRDEIFVLTQLSGNMSKHFLWQARCSGLQTEVSFAEIKR